MSQMSTSRVFKFSATAAIAAGLLLTTAACSTASDLGAAPTEGQQVKAVQGVINAIKSGNKAAFLRVGPSNEQTALLAWKTCSKWRKDDPQFEWDGVTDADRVSVLLAAKAADPLAGCDLTLIWLGNGQWQIDSTVGNGGNTWSPTPTASPSASTEL